jgi:hypothetical protein
VPRLRSDCGDAHARPHSCPGMCEQRGPRGFSGVAVGVGEGG